MLNSMESTNLDLTKILRGHEGQKLYSKAHGEVIFEKIQELGKNVKHIICSYTSKINGLIYTAMFLPNGQIEHEGEMMLFPSKDQEDWLKWDEENNHKVPKTWSEYLRYDKCEITSTISLSLDDKDYLANDTPIEKSALAFIKILKLIEVGYGGNVTNKDYIELELFNEYLYHITYNTTDKEFEILANCSTQHTPIMFHTKEQAKEFLSYPENIQLLKDYFIIS